MKKMNLKKRLGLLFAGVMTASLIFGSVAVYARDFEDAESVTFDGKKMTSTFDKVSLVQQAQTMQPGDTLTINITMNNDASKTSDWYIKNKVVSSLEQSSKDSGGAYTYKLTYSGTSAPLYESDTVGGENGSSAGTGLMAATDNLDEWFLVDSLGAGESGVLTLFVQLDGETQGNAYMDKLADLTFDFAVEPDSGTEATNENKTTNTVTRNAVKTGDENPNVLLIVLAAVAGAVMLVIGIYGAKLRKRAAAEGGEYVTVETKKGGRS